MAVLADQMREHHLLGKLLNATYVSSGRTVVPGVESARHRRDHASRDILLTDVFTAFGQRLAGTRSSLEPVNTSWREWLHRCAGLAMHPAVPTAGSTGSAWYAGRR